MHVLGLIVTELVINALKYAFADRDGAVTVRYEAQDQDWVLCVSDDGIGMPPDPRPAGAGLGTSIVLSLAKQLGATVSLGESRPGTSVTVSHLTSKDWPGKISLAPGAKAHLPLN